MGARVRLEEAVEGGVDVVFGTVLQQAVDQFGQLGFPVCVFQLAAGFGKAVGQALEFGAVAREAVARAEAGAFHRCSGKWKERDSTSR